MVPATDNRFYLGFNSGSKYENIESVSRISSAYLSLQAEFQPWHTEVLENFNKVSGKIYSETDLQRLRNDRRPSFQWNLFIPIIQSIASNFKNSIPGLDFIGETEEDHGSADLAKKMQDWTMFQCNDVVYELSKAFLYAIIGRIGWLCQEYTFNDPRFPEGKISIKWYDGLRLMFDTNFTRRDVSDMRFVQDTGMYSPEEIILTYARKKSDLAEEIYRKGTEIIGVTASTKIKDAGKIATWSERILGINFGYPGEKRGFDINRLDYQTQPGNDWYNGRGLFRVVDSFEKRMVPSCKIYDWSTGEERDITEQIKLDKAADYTSFTNKWFDNDKLQLFKQQFTEPSVRMSREIKTFQTSVCPGMQLELYDGLSELQNGYLKFIPVLCQDFHPDIMETKSIVDHIKEPIESINHRRNTMLTYLMRAAHGGYLAEQGAVKDFMDSFINNEIGGVKLVKDNALAQDRIKEITVPQFPAALDRFTQEEGEALNKIGTSPENFRGNSQTSNENASLMAQRVEQAEILQEWISENAQSSFIIVAHNNFELFRKYFKHERTIMLLMDKTKPEWITINKRSLDQLINDTNFGKYSVIISKAPYGRMSKERDFSKIVMISEKMIAAQRPELVDWTLIVENSGLSVADKWIERIKTVEQQATAQLEEAAAIRTIQNDQNVQKSNLELKKYSMEVDQLYNQMANESVIQNQRGFNDAA